MFDSLIVAQRTLAIALEKKFMYSWAMNRGGRKLKKLGIVGLVNRAERRRGYRSTLRRDCIGGDKYRNRWRRERVRREWIKLAGREEGGWW